MERNQTEAHTGKKRSKKMNRSWLAMVVHFYNPGTWEVEEGRPRV